MKKERKKGEAAKLEMTPMIDVVFQLLIFFLVTLKPEDILSRLEVSRPAPDPNQKKEEEVDLLTVVVYNQNRLAGQGISLKGRQITYEELDRQLHKLAGFSKTISVIIKCTSDSPHANLVKVLDICAKNDLKNLAVFSM